MDRPCFACARFYVDPETGSPACRTETDSSIITLALPFARSEGASCGPEGRRFVARLLQQEESRPSA